MGDEVEVEGKTVAVDVPGDEFPVIPPRPCIAFNNSLISGSSKCPVVSYGVA
jgi:hypothetical protein